MKSVGVMIGWNENLHTLGPPWRRLDIPALWDREIVRSRDCEISLGLPGMRCEV